jgi:hypothetical protein
MQEIKGIAAGGEECTVIQMKITLQDCIAMCGLTEEEVLAIAEHEHQPEIVGTALASYLLGQEHGTEKIRDMIVECSARRPGRSAMQEGSAPTERIDACGLLLVFQPS